MTDVKLLRLLKHLNIFIEKDLNVILKEMDLTSSQGRFLLMLTESENGTLSLKEFERKFKVAQSTVFGIISRLEKKGLVTTSFTENKNKIVTITNEGKELTSFFITCIKTSENKIFIGFTPEEKTLFIDFLLRAEHNCIPTNFHE